MPDIQQHSLPRGKRHSRPAPRDEEGNRITRTERTGLYGHKWRRLRDWFLRRNPLCEDCKAMNPPRVTQATEVDHIIPHKGDMKLFWDRNNLSAKCKPHHSAKTMREINEARKYVS